MTAEDQLTRVLGNRAAEIPDTVELTDVRARVGRVRRRRRTALALAAAAVVAAVVVPTAIALQRPAATGPVVPTPTPTPTPSVSPSPTPSTPSPTPWQVQQLHTSKAFAMLPAGASPKLAYVYGGHTLAAPGQEPAALPAPIDGVTGLTPLGGGWLVASAIGADGRSSGMSTQAEGAVNLLDGQLRPVWVRYGAHQVAAGDGVTAYFAQPDRAETAGALHLVGEDGARLASWTIPFGQAAVPVGITPERQVVYNLMSDAGSFLGVWVTRPHAGTERLPMWFTTAASGDLVSGQLRNGCQVVWALRTSTELWHTCAGYRIAGFSPDGHYVAAWHTATGGEFESVVIFDARTGARVTDSTADAPADFHGLPSGDVAWEDDNHLLIAFIADGDWETLRLALDGHLERATNALQTDTDGAFVFATEPPQPAQDTQTTSPRPLCQSSDLRLSLGPRVSEATGQNTLILVLRNTADHECTLRGYPTIEAGSAEGKLLPFRYRHGSDMMLRHVTPATVSLSPDRPAYVVINKYRCDSGDLATATHLHITPPGASAPAGVHLGGRGGMPWCGLGDPGSTVTVSPVVSSPGGALR